MWTEKCLSDSWLHTNKEIARKKIISYNKLTGLQNYLSFRCQLNLKQLNHIKRCKFRGSEGEGIIHGNAVLCRI